MFDSKIEFVKVGTSLIVVCCMFAWQGFRYIWERAESSREDEIRNCAAGCVNLGKKDTKCGSGFLIQGSYRKQSRIKRLVPEIFELREKLKEKYSQFLNKKGDWYTDFKYLVITNHHVINEIARTTTFHDSNETKPINRFRLDGDTSIDASIENLGKRTNYSARIIETDKDNDLALLAVVFKHGEEHDLVEDYTGIKCLQFDPNEPKLLEAVYAFGCPEKLESSVTKGIISHLNRKEDRKTFYQTDAPINSGNSGGPLINNFGMVVGVATQKISSDGVRMVENISYAIPAWRVKQFLERDSVKLCFILTCIAKLSFCRSYSVVY